MEAKYAAAWETQRGPGDSRPTGLQIIKDNDLLGKLSGKVIFITGCSSGIGIETARALKETGAELFLTARNQEKAKLALGDILEPGRVHLLHLDLESLESVRACVKEFKGKSKSLNILINNAGVRYTPKGKTKDGFETQFGTNHVAHFLLFQLLKPMLLASSMPDFNSRVVAVSSIAHRESRLDFDDLNMEKRGYNYATAYSQSKLANGLHGWSVHPGGIWTGLQKFNFTDLCMILKQGCSTTVWAAVGKSLEGKGGKYLERCSISIPVKKGYALIDPGHALHAFNKEDALRLWQVTCALVGLENDE
ncbi:NAD(P)-binding protein [Stipitochalara longipes BDJ]|nr:NAD(P)-binding protein [Stipitochalara longipes BDJ]